MMLNQVLRLERPLAVLDLETTGLVIGVDRIIQIAITIHYPQDDARGHGAGYVEWSSLVNPEVPITNQGSHKITDADVRDAPTFGQIAPALAPKLMNVDISGHNAAQFDKDFLAAEFRRVGVDWLWNGHVVDTLKILRMVRPNTLENAYKWYVDPKGFQGAHDAAADVRATTKLLYAMLNEHQELPRTPREIEEFCSKRKDAIDKDGKFIWINGVACINFGKHRGKPIKDIDKNYLIWMINQQNFPDEAVIIAGNALKGIYPEK